MTDVVLTLAYITVLITALMVERAWTDRRGGWVTLHEALFGINLGVAILWAFRP